MKVTWNIVQYDTGVLGQYQSFSLVRLAWPWRPSLTCFTPFMKINYRNFNIGNPSAFVQSVDIENINLLGQTLSFSFYSIWWLISDMAISKPLDTV